MRVVPVEGRTLESITSELLDVLTPETQDKVFLNAMTARQICSMTYRENVLPRNSSDANILVPQDLYQTKLNQLWRYPPHITVDFLVRRPTREAVLRITGGFAVSRYLRYGEHRLFGRAMKRMYIAQACQVQTPTDFGTARIEGKTYNVSEAGAFRPISVQPVFYEFSAELKITPDSRGELLSRAGEIPFQRATIKVFNETSGGSWSADPSASLSSISAEHEPSIPPPDRGERQAFIDLISGPVRFALLVQAEEEPGIGEEWMRLTVRLVNTQSYHQSPPRDLEWRQMSMIFPYLSIDTKSLEVRIPPQQHMEVLSEAIERTDDERGVSYLDLYHAHNGVLARSTEDATKLVVTMFGVFDRVREKPVEGPPVQELVNDNAGLLAAMNLLSTAQKERLQANSGYLDTIRAVILSLQESEQVAGDFLYKFQWEAIQLRIAHILEGEEGTTTVIKAPTGAGKTAVFMGNAALFCLLVGKRVVMVFPTRILNEDMFRRLTRFIYSVRKNTRRDITGGIFIGTSDPLYNPIAYPEEGKQMLQYGTCPACGGHNTIIARSSDQQQGNRLVGRCDACGHAIDYMYGPRDASNFLPTITIATPDKLFYEATVSGAEAFPLRFFGGLFKRCTCGYCAPAMDRRTPVVNCRNCGRQVRLSGPESAPIGYYVFDEVHSLYGLTGTLLSIFLATLNLVHSKIQDWKDRYIVDGLKEQPTYEVGTATITNEIKLMHEITRYEESKIQSFPTKTEYPEYFVPDESQVRYRTLVILPIAKAARTTVSYSLLDSYQDFHLNDWREGLAGLVPLGKGVNALNAYDFILGYLFRKSDGYVLKRTIEDLGRQRLNTSLRVEFLSGDSTTRQVAQIFERAQRNQIELLLANMVISLGLDIRNLNNVIMMGIPKTMTEYIQIAGRTGRGTMPGHVTVHLLPSNPRDMFVFENFHHVMSDVEGYFDTMPIESTNAYAAQIILPNVFKALLAAISYRPYSYCLTAQGASRYFGDSRLGSQRYKQGMYDLMLVLTDNATPEGVKREILKQTEEEIRYYLGRWVGLRGQGQWISNWLEREQLLLQTLRERTGRDIKVTVDDTRLLAAIEQQLSISSIGREYTYEDEATEEEDRDTVEG